MIVAVTVIALLSLGACCRSLLKNRGNTKNSQKKNFFFVIAKLPPCIDFVQAPQPDHIRSKADGRIAGDELNSAHGGVFGNCLVDYFVVVYFYRFWPVSLKIAAGFDRQQ